MHYNMFAFHLHACVGVDVCVHLCDMRLSVSVFAMYSGFKQLYPTWVHSFIY